MSTTRRPTAFMGRSVAHTIGRRGVDRGPWRLRRHARCERASRTFKRLRNWPARSAWRGNTSQRVLNMSESCVLRHQVEAAVVRDRRVHTCTRLARANPSEAKPSRAVARAYVVNGQIVHTVFTTFGETDADGYQVDFARKEREARSRAGRGLAELMVLGDVTLPHDSWLPRRVSARRCLSRIVSDVSGCICMCLIVSAWA